MDRVVRLYQLWSWLPHFRAIAETEHLPTASEALGLSPSALSRALKQLEAAVGRDLFVRDGRTIRINDHGQELLRAVRLAMRSIDDALTSLAGDQGRLPLRIAAPGPFHSAVILDIVAQITAQYERVSVEMSSCAPDEIVPSLCRGHVDVCLHETPIEHADLESVLLAMLPKRVACAPSHPLASASDLDRDGLADHAFAAPPKNEGGGRDDGWPVGVPRRVDLTVTHMQMGIDACVGGHYLAVLPRPIIAAVGLLELQIDGVELPQVSLFATTRKRLETQPVEFKAFLEALVAAFAGS